MFTGRALVLESPGSILLKKISLGSLQPGNVIVRVRYAALCGSDIKLFQGNYTGPHHYPLIIGHEWVGEIVMVGEGVRDKWKVNDIVTGDCSIYCGECDFCALDRNHCSSVKKRGITVDGACSEYITIPAEYLYRCPSMDDIMPLALAEPLAVVVQGINSMGEATPKRIKKALVIGAGGIGIMGVFTLLDMAVERITVVDTAGEKLSVISSFEYPNVNTLEMNLGDNKVDLGQDYDLVIEASGSEYALRKALDVLAPCGSLVCIGHQKKVELDFGIIIKKSLRIFGSIGGTGGFEQALRMIGKNRKAISKIITRVVPLEKAEGFFVNELDTSRNIKIVIDLN